MISLLQSVDPDVQKNALETLALMLQDHQSRTAIRAQGGITPVLQMLKSEYPGWWRGDGGRGAAEGGTVKGFGFIDKISITGAFRDKSGGFIPPRHQNYSNLALRCPQVR